MFPVEEKLTLKEIRKNSINKLQLESNAIFTTPREQTHKDKKPNEKKKKKNFKKKKKQKN